MTTDFARGRALVIAPAFFGYEKDIVAEFERQGYDTTFIDERPSNNTIARAVLRVRKGVMARRIEGYYRAKIADLTGKRFDVVLVIKAEVIPRWFLVHLRRTSPDARFVFYSWDAVSNAGNCLELLDCFDELLSFDRDDVAARPQFSYLPLFYTRDFAPLSERGSSRPRRYTLSFVGTLHTERYAFIKQLFAGHTGTFAFFYLPARWYFIIVKCLTREHRSIPWRDVSFNKLSRGKVAEIFRESVAVVDMQRRGQSGLTIRTFEVLASGSVLVTTNAAITREPFFEPTRVIVIPGDAAGLASDDLRRRLDSIAPPSGPPASFDRYSLASWVNTILAGPRREEDQAHESTDRSRRGGVGTLRACPGLQTRPALSD